MTLGLNMGGGGGNGDFTPIVTWDARAGRMFRIDRQQDVSGQWGSDKVDITADAPVMLLDFGTVEVGWIAFLPTGPSFHLVPLGQPLAERPSTEHKQGVRLRVYSPKFLGGLREFASTAKSVLGVIDTLHTMYERSPEAVAGQIPAVQLQGATAIVTRGPQGNVTSYAPNFRVVSWAPRLKALGPRTVALPGRAAVTPPAAAVAAVAPVVAARPVPVMAPTPGVATAGNGAADIMPWDMPAAAPAPAAQAATGMPVEW